MSKTNDKVKSAYESLIHNNGRSFTAEDFILPADEDFFQSGLDIGILNNINHAQTGDMFYIEAPFETQPGYYNDKKIFVLKATPLTRYLGKDHHRYGNALLAEDLNRIDADTFLFLNKSITDGNAPFTIGNHSYSSFRDYIGANENPNSDFRLRTLGINAPEVPHYTAVPVSKRDKNLHVVKAKYQTVKNNKNYLCATRSTDSNDEIKFFHNGEGKYYEIIKECYEDDPNVAASSFPRFSDKTREEVTYFKVLIQPDESELDTIADALAATDKCIEMMGKAEDIRLLVDHKTLNKSSSNYKKPYDDEYYSNNQGVTSNVWHWVFKRYNEFFADDVRFTHFGFNDPGMDSHKRFLGSIYLKMNLRDLPVDRSLIDEEAIKEGSVWINLQKYILFNFKNSIQALPDYSGDPTDKYHDTFVSSAFRLWSYDIDNYEDLDEMIASTDEHITQRNKFYQKVFGINYQDMLDYYMILGDTVFLVPPTSIRSVTQVKHNRMPLMRTKGMASSSSSKSEKIIELSLYFNNDEGVNGIPTLVKLPNGQTTTYYMGGLRSLIAQFQLTPFLPIENQHVNKILNIEAVSLIALNVNTVPGYPKLLEAVLTLQEFNYRVYMPELPVPDYSEDDIWKTNLFSRTINYPVMRWYYQRLLQKGAEFDQVDALHPRYLEATTIGIPPLVPMRFENSKIDFYLPNTEHLDQRLQLAIETDTKPIVSGMNTTDSMVEHMKLIGDIAKTLEDLLKDSNYNQLLKSLTIPIHGTTSQKYNFSNSVLEIAKPTNNPVSYLSVAPNWKEGYEWPRVKSRMQTVFYSYKGGEFFEFTNLGDWRINERNPESDPLKTEKLYQIITNKLSNYGSATICEGHSEKPVSNEYGSKFIYKFSVDIPIPSMLDSNEERDLMNKIKSEIGYELSDLISENNHGQKSTRVTWTAEAAFLNNGNALIIGDFEFDKSCPGNMFLQYCKDFSKQNAADEHAQDLQDQNVYETTGAIQFEKYYLGEDLNIQQISCSYINSFANLSLSADDGYAHQYCGGQDIAIDITFTTQDQSAAILLEGLPRMAAYTVRHYKRILSSWPLRIDSEITRLFGVNEVLIESSSVDTVPNHPGVYSINLRLLGLDRCTRSKEALKKLDINNSGGSSVTDHQLELKNYFDLNSVLSEAEIYPDLALPTLDELEYVRYTANRYKTGLPSTRKYVDPDFYFSYGHTLSHEIFRKAILESFNTLEKDFVISDKYSAASILSAVKNDKDAVDYTRQDGTLNQEILAHMKEVNKVITYEDYSTLLEEGLSRKSKAKKQLMEVGLSLKTPIWNITEDMRFPFREQQFKDISKTEDKAFHDLISDAENKAYDTINTALNSKLDVSNLDIYTTIEYDFKRNKPRLGISKTAWIFMQNCKNDMKMVAENYFGTVDLYNALIFEQDDLGSYKMQNEVVDKMLKIMLAAADTGSGDTYGYTNTFWNPETDDEVAEHSSWQFKPFLNIENGVPNEKDLALNVRVCIPTEPNIKYARSLEEAIQYGHSFGVFQIKKLSKKEILDIVIDQEERRLIENSDLANGYFLDPYYRNLQINDPESEELREYIIQLCYSPGYSTAAFIRNMLYWYKRMLDDEIAISVYENIRGTALKQFKKNNKKGEVDLEDVVGDGTFGEKVDSLVGSLSQDADYLMKQLYLEMLYDAYDKDRKKLKDEIFLKETVRVPENLLKMVMSNTEPLSSFKKIKEKYKEILDTGETALYGEYNNTSQELKKLAKQLLDTIEQYEQSNEKERQNQVTSFGTMYSIYKSQFEQEMNLAEKSYEAIAEYFEKDKTALILGKFFVIASLTTCGSYPIYNMLKDYNINGLESMLLSATVPSNTLDNTMLKKYLLACDKRKVLKAEQLGSKLQSPEEMIKNYVMESVFIHRSEDVYYYMRDSFIDMIQHDKRGRMLRAFPTYYMMFIDEGREIGFWKIHDNFYNMNAIAEINVTKSRKIAADTAEFTMTNLLKSYTTQEYEIEYLEDNASKIRYNMVDAFNSLFSPKVYYMKEELKRINEHRTTKTALKPGIRIHMRLGYGADASELPIMFNGVVAEVGGEDLVQIVAQGDGVELLNPIMDMQDTDEVEFHDDFFISKMFKNWVDNGATPREILTSILNTKGTWIQNKIRSLSKGRFFNNNPYGIVHFGDVDWKDIFANGEASQNIYEVNPRASFGKGELTGLEKNYVTKETPKITTSVFGKTFWDLMHICASTSPEYMTSIVPFNLRSSIFLGAGRYYYAYDYAKIVEENNQTRIIEKRKPFQQQHIYTSFGDIIGNNITASGKNIRTAAIGLYRENGWLGIEKSKQIGPLYADYDIYPEFQKTMTVDTQYQAKGLPIMGNGFGINTSLDADVGDLIPGAKEIAWRMTASALKESMKDMYDGELIVIGDATVKPYDRVWIEDIMENMSGSFEVEAVVHSFNASTGFTTSIFADCISAVDDEHEKFSKGLTSQAVGVGIAGVGLMATAAAFGYRGKPIVGAMGDIATKNIVKATPKIAQLGKFLGQDDVEIAHKMLNGNDVIRKSLAGKSDPGLTSLFMNMSGTANNLEDVFGAITKLDPTDVSQATGVLREYQKAVESMSKQDLDALLTFPVDDVSIEEARRLLDSVGNSIDEISRISYDIFSPENQKGLSRVVDILKEADPESALVKRLDILLDTPSKFTTKDIGMINDALISASKIGDHYDEVFDISKAIATTTKAAASKSKGVASVIKTAFSADGLKALFTLAKSNPIVMVIWTVVEFLIWEAVAGFTAEYLERMLQNLEVLQIYPLKKRGRALVAGLNGHKGSVVGSPTFNDQGPWTSLLISLFDGKSNGTMLKFVLNCFTSTRLQEIANNLKRESGYPDPEFIDTDLKREELLNSFMGDMSGSLIKVSNNNNRHVLNIPREDKYDSDKAAIFFNNNIISSTVSSYPNSEQLEKETVPIAEHNTIKKLISNNFFAFNPLMNHDTVMTFDGINRTVAYSVESNNCFNVSTLRPDALVLLSDILSELALQVDTTKMIDNFEVPQVYLKSATLVNDMSWEATGLGFRLDTELDLNKACETLKKKYSKSGIKDCFYAMGFTDEPEHNMIFIMKPPSENL